MKIYFKYIFHLLVLQSLYNIIEMTSVPLYVLQARNYNADKFYLFKYLLKVTTTTTVTSIWQLFFKDNLGKPSPER